MKIRLMSDIHLEFGDYIIPKLPEDQNTVLVLAGDITCAGRQTNMRKVFLPFMERCSKQFNAVVYIFGNHEYYETSFHEAKERITRILSDLNNVYILEKSTVIIGSVAFIGTTLWTDCGSLQEAHPMSSMYWNGMTDSQVIKYSNDKKMTVEDCRKEFLDSRKFILSEVPFQRALGNSTVVVVHHAVSDKSVHPQYRVKSCVDMNKFFKSDMDLDLVDANPDYIIHGHMHNASNYMLDEQLCNTRVICNPLGYKGYESSPESRGFNPLLTIEI